MTRALAVSFIVVAALGTIWALLVLDEIVGFTRWLDRLERRFWMRWYLRRHPRCRRDAECLLDDGHKGDCDTEPYT